MLSLPSDIHLLILDYITLKSDLKSLCSTSKGLRALALPLLYESITIATRDSDQQRLLRFIKCVAAGAGLHLRHTRILTFDDTNAPEEPYSQQIGRLNFDPDFRLDKEYTSEDVDGIMHAILVSIPENTLHTFRFISDRAIPMKVLRRLYLVQSKIRHLCASWGDVTVPRQHWLTMPPGRLRSLDVFFTDNDSIGHVLQYLLDSGTQLERLALGGAETRSTDVLKWHLQGMKDDKRLSNLKELTLNNFSLESIYTAIADIIDFTALERLTLFGCEEADLFLEEMGTQTLGAALSLRHLAVQVQDDTCLEDILDSCSNLMSLHLRWEDDADPSALLGRLRDLGSSLRTLALHQNREDPPPDEWDRILSYCPNLRQLGCQLSTYVFDPNEWCNDFPEVLDALGQLPDLRIVHFRYVRFEELARFEWRDFRKPREITWEVQRFANGFFQYLDDRNLCPKLKALAFGVNWTPRRPLAANEYSVPRHCFIKGWQTDALNRRTAIAVPVPTYRLRELDPELDILDFDPECEWVGGLPGRFLHR